MAEVLLFNVDNQRLAFDINQIERVIWAVEVTPAPKAPKCLLGVINMQGRVIPVVNMRHLLRMPKRKMQLSDQLLICSIADKTVALWVDSVQGISTYKESDIVSGPDLFPDMELVDYVIKNDDKMIFVYKWDQLIPIEEVENSTRAAT